MNLNSYTLFGSGGRKITVFGRGKPQGFLSDGLLIDGPEIEVLERDGSLSPFGMAFGEGQDILSREDESEALCEDCAASGGDARDLTGVGE